MALSSCSLGMKYLPGDYDERTIPRCETNAAYPAGDAIAAVAFAGLGVAIAVAGHDAEDGSSKWLGVGLMGVAAGLMTIVAVEGFKGDARCTRAIEQWDQRQIDQDTLVQDARLKDSMGAKEEARRYDESKHSATAPAAPRGFFCSSSPSNTAAGFCARDKSECRRTREVAIVGVADLTECTLTETAWCAEKRCAPSEEICVATRARLGSDAEECVEEK